MQSLHTDEQQQEILLVDGAEHVEPFRADRTQLLVLVVQPVEKLLEVEELQVRVKTVIAKDSHRSGLVSVGNCSHFARGSLPTCESVMFDEIFALAGCCNGM